MFINVNIHHHVIESLYLTAIADVEIHKLDHSVSRNHACIKSFALGKKRLQKWRATYYDNNSIFCKLSENSLTLWVEQYWSLLSEQQFSRSCWFIFLQNVLMATHSLTRSSGCSSGSLYLLWQYMYACKILFQDSSLVNNIVDFRKGRQKNNKN